MHADHALRTLPHASVAEMAASILSFGAYALTNSVEYQEEGIPFLRCMNIKNDFVSFDDCLRITPEAHELLHKSEIEPETVLLTMSGSVGNATVALPTWQYPVNSNQDIAKIVVQDIDPYYLASFFGSHYGKAQMRRLPVGSVQQHIFLSMIETIIVSRLDEKLEKSIGRLCRTAYSTRDVADKILKSADSLLLEKLGLHDWSAPEPLAYRASASSVVEARRFDANYFAPKYEAVFAKLRATGAAKTLNDGMATLVSRGSQPEYNEAGLPVINSKHVRTNRVLLSDDNRRAVPKKLLIQRGDVLVNGTGVGTIGRAAPYLDEQDAVPDNHVTVVRPTEINPLYLSVYLNSQVGQLQIERMISGSSGQIELYPADIRRIVIWDAPKELQQEIADAIQRSFAMENQASELLAAAKRAVEIAIEDGEAAAIDFIAEQEA